MNLKLTFDPRTKFVLATFLFGIGSLINAWLGLGWWLASALTAVLLGIYLWYIWKHKDPVLGRLLLFGLAAGFVELFADCWGEGVGGLVYDHAAPFNGGPFIMCSPLYMPFAWAIVMIQIGYLGYWFTQMWGLRTATIVTTILGAINIPTYEFLAKASNLWYYQNVTLLFDTVPYYVIFAESLICLVLPFTVTWLEKKKWWWSIPIGIGEGLWMWVAGYIGLSIFH